jgi:hypothetical protein
MKSEEKYDKTFKIYIYKYVSTVQVQYSVQIQCTCKFHIFPFAFDPNKRQSL